MKRIGVLQILQESNSFNPIATTKSDYERYGIATGSEVIDRYGTLGGIGGFLEGIKLMREPVEAVGIIRLQASPGGPIDRATLDWILDLMKEQLKSAGELDGALFALHGAMICETDDDVEGRICEATRTILGPQIPIVVTLDLHTHLTPKMVSMASTLVAYHTSPHIDLVETGIRGAAALERIFAGAKPAVAARTLPMITVSEAQQTGGAVLGPVYRRAVELESEPRVLSVAVLMTQSWLDVPELGWSVCVTTDRDQSYAESIADELAEACWLARDALTEQYLSAAECVRSAKNHTGNPVIIADGPDATNSGSTGDSTWLLSEMLNQGVPGGGLVIVVDPDAVAVAANAGDGGRFSFAVGGKLAPEYSTPVVVEGVVERVTPARYVLSGHGGVNLPIDMGLSATVRSGDVTILLVESPGPGGTPLMYECVGLDPRKYKIVIVKSPAGFRAEYGPFASEILLSDSPGCASPRFDKLGYKRITHPLSPFDTIENRESATWCSERWR